MCSQNFRGVKTDRRFKSKTSCRQKVAASVTRAAPNREELGQEQPEGTAQATVKLSFFPGEGPLGGGCHQERRQGASAQGAPESPVNVCQPRRPPGLCPEQLPAPPSLPRGPGQPRAP